MKLFELIHGFGFTFADAARITPPSTAERGGVEVTDITDDSRTVTPGCIFIARGEHKTDGRKFIDDAVAKDAAVVLEEGGDQGNKGPRDQGQGKTAGSSTASAPSVAGSLGPSVPLFLLAPRVDHALTSRLAKRFFGEPGKKLKLIAVTGTKGKTTTAFIAQHLLHRSGVKAGLIGTVLIDDGATRTPAELTTPGGVEFSRVLAAMVKNGCRAAVAEVSSHALHQGRLAGLDFTVGVFTNLTGDHLDYHGTMEEYAAAKAILFRGLKPGAFAVINRDDKWAGEMVRECGAKIIESRVSGLGSHVEGKTAGDPSSTRDTRRETRDAVATIIELGASWSRVKFDGPWGSVEVTLPMAGKHNVMNTLEALAAANCVVDVSSGLRETLEKCPAPPGRLEPVRIEEGSRVSGLGSRVEEKTPGTASSSTRDAGRETRDRLPTVLVDYAHTHDALVNVLGAVRPFTKGKLITVFGCGGDRDRTKRPKMAAVVCHWADVAVVTSDNPRTEDPMFILGQVVGGVPAEHRPRGWKMIPVEGISENDLAPFRPGEALSRKRPGGLEVIVEPDRARAIAAAVAMAGPDDTVLIAGKGHEDYQIIGTTKRHFDDREEAAKALRAKLGQDEAVLAS